MATGRQLVRLSLSPARIGPRHMRDERPPCRQAGGEADVQRADRQTDSKTDSKRSGARFDAHAAQLGRRRKHLREVHLK